MSGYCRSSHYDHSRKQDHQQHYRKGGAVSGGNEVETAASRVKKIIKDENVKTSLFGLIRSIINLIKVISEDKSQTEKLAAGKDVFIQSVAAAVKATLVAYDLGNPMTFKLVDWLTPIVAGGLYDFIVRKVREQEKKKKMRGGVVVDELPYHPDIITNIIETYFYFLNLELDKFM